MIIDASAIVAIALREPEAARMVTAITQAPVRQMSALNSMEALMVVEARLGRAPADGTLLLIRTLEVEILPFDQNHMTVARTAWQRFGKGRHPAALNLADCCAYAAAIVTNQPLLFKGNDFGKTDVQCAEW